MGKVWKVDRGREEGEKRVYEDEMAEGVGLLFWGGCSWSVR